MFSTLASRCLFLCKHTSVSSSGFLRVLGGSKELSRSLVPFSTNEKSEIEREDKEVAIYSDSITVC